MKLLAVQHDIQWEDKEANFAKVRKLVENASPATGGLVVLPEMFATGFSTRLEVTKEERQGPTAAFLRSLADETGCAVMGGYVQATTGGLGQNVVLCVAPDGQELAHYVKQQPFTLGGEREVHAPGCEPCVFDYAGMRIAPLICYDLRFPELARATVALGAEVLVFIASWPVKRAQHWVTLLQARAIENQAWVVGVNRCGTDPHFLYPGRTLVVDPHGNIIADAADREQVLQAYLDPAVVRQWRAEFPALRDADM
jgi:predicted amidohydrolase